MASPSTAVHLSRVPSLSWDDCRLLVENVVDYAIFMLDAEGYVATWNRGAEKIYGYHATEIVGQHFSAFHTRDDIDAGIPALRQQAACDIGRLTEDGWRVRRDGTRFWANVVLTALRDENGALRGYGKVTRDLTAQRLAEEELHRSEERFRLLVDNIGDYAIYMLDPSGHVVTWNLGAERMKGYAAQEIIGQNFQVFFPKEDVESDKPKRELAMAQAQGRFEDEGWRVRKDGSRFWVNAIVTPLRDREGGLVGFAKITRDLTKRREAEELERRLLREEAAREVAERAEQKIRESQELYRSLSQRLEIVFEGVADGITVQDSTGTVIFANNAAARVCGSESTAALIATPPEEVVSRFDILDESGAPVEPAQLPGRRVLAGDSSSRALLCVRNRRTRATRWCIVRAAEARDAESGSRIAVNIWHDVTQEYRQEQHAKHLAAATAALSASLEASEVLDGLAHALVPGLADWCVIHLTSGEELNAATIAHADPKQLARAYDYQRRFPPDRNDTRGVWNVVRTGVAELYSDVPDALLADAISNAERRAVLTSMGMKAAMLVPIRSRSGVVGVLSLVAGESGRTYDEADLGLAEEIGRRAGLALDHARLYAVAQEAATAAEEASRAKDEFLAIVSHELRTPLNAIVGWSSLLKERTPDPTISRAFSVIHRNAEAQVKIIEDILDVSRVITGKFRLDPKPMDLVSVVHGAIDVVRASSDAKQISIDFAPDSPTCLIFADPVRMQQVVWNLLSNAVKFTESGGRIRVTLLSEGANVAVAVDDNGRGIDPAFLPFVFDRFRQADSSITRRVGGLGLGLALVRHIIELHGGHVSAHSAGIGSGSRFIVTIPMRAIEAGGHAQVRSRALTNGPAEDVLAAIRVLVVDDEPDTRELVETVLRNAGALVELATSAEEAIAKLAEFHPDVLISDLGMPDMDGLTLMRRVRARSPNFGGHVPAIALTALAREEDCTAALRAGYTTHIGKPVDPHALTAAVANLAMVNRGS